MEKPEQNEVEVVEEDILNTSIGSIEKASIKPAVVTISGVVIKTHKSDGTEMKIPSASVLVIHPDKKDEPIAISKVTYVDGKVIKTAGLWVQLDADEKIQKGSAIDRLLSYHKCSTLKELSGKVMDTVQESEDSKYLSLKAY